MKMTIIKVHEHPIAVLESIDPPLSTVQDALDLMVNADYQGARKIMIKKEHLHPDFFDLKTRLAGEMLQKFVNYYMKLAVIGDFSEYKSKNFRDFMYESNKAGQIVFAEDTQAAVKFLTRD